MTNIIGIVAGAYVMRQLGQLFRNACEAFGGRPRDAGLFSECGGGRRHSAGGAYQFRHCDS